MKNNAALLKVKLKVNIIIDCNPNIPNIAFLYPTLSDNVPQTTRPAPLNNAAHAPTLLKNTSVNYRQ